MRSVTRFGCVIVAAVVASGCGQSAPIALQNDGGDNADSATSPLPPLEAAAPPVIPSVRRKDAASSIIVFDAVRGGVWVGNGDVGSVSYVNVATQTVVAEIAVGQDITSVALSPDGLWVAAVDRMGASVSLINANTRTLARTIATGTHPRAAVWDAANPRWLYVAVEDSGAVALIDRTLGVLTSTAPVGRLPSGVAVSAMRRELYVTQRIDAQVSVFPLAALPESEVDASVFFEPCPVSEDAGDDGSTGGNGPTTSDAGGSGLADGGTVAAPDAGLDASDDASIDGGGNVAPPPSVDSGLPVAPLPLCAVDAASLTPSSYGPPYNGGPSLAPDATAVAEIELAYEDASAAPTVPHGNPFGFESLAWATDGRTAWLPMEILANTHPFQFQTTLFPSVGVVDLEQRIEVPTNPNDPNGIIAGRKDLFDAINLIDETGNVTIMSQPCAAAFHPNGTTAYVIMCGSEDIVKFDLTQGIAVDILRDIPGDHPVGIAMDPAGSRAYIFSDQTHSVSTFDLADGSLVEHVSLLAGPLVTVAHDPVAPLMRTGLTLFYRANSSKGALASTGNNWMSCAGCHLDGFVSTNEAFFDFLSPLDPTVDARIGHEGLVDLFSTLPDPNSPSDSPLNPHDVLVAMTEMGGLTPDRKGQETDAGVNPSSPDDAAVQMVVALAQVVNRDLPLGPSWLLAGPTAPNLAYDTAWCGNCHAAEYNAWKNSVHAHSAIDPMVTACVRNEQAIVGQQLSRQCAGCHDPVSARAGDTTMTSGRGLTCLGCHEEERLIQAGGNSDIEYLARDWTQSHKASASATLVTLRNPAFCAVCHEQFVPGTGLSAINTFGEWEASSFSGLVDDAGEDASLAEDAGPVAPPIVTTCVSCHVPVNDAGTADHTMLGGNYYVASQIVGDMTMAAAEQAKIASGLTLTLGPDDAGGGSAVAVVVSNTNIGHSFPTGVTDLREPWVELQAVGATGAVVAHYGGPLADGTIALDAGGRFGEDLADVNGNILYEHQLPLAVSVPFSRTVPAGGSITVNIPWPGTLPSGATELDAVLYYRNIRTQYIRLATGDAGATAPQVEVARIKVQ